MKPTLYHNKHKQPLSLSETGLYEKELIYVGNFQDGTKKFSITENDLNGWVNTFKRMESNGIEVKVPSTHSFKPDDERGTIVGLEVKKNKEGIPALYGKIKFFDNIDVTPYINSDVSIEVPDKIVDGKGNVYKYPIRHVALTSYPVIPKLGKFLSLSLIQEGENQMDILKAIAEVLGITVTDQTEETLRTQILDALKPAMTEEGIADVVEKVAEAIVANELVLSKLKLALAESPKENHSVIVDDPEKKELQLSLAKLTSENREVKIESLVREGYMTPAAATIAKKQFANGSVLSLSQDVNQNFDNFIELTKANGKVIDMKERTSGQVLSCSMDVQNNPLLADAERRSK